MIWTVINVTLSLIVGGIVALKLGLWHWRFNLGERIGMGLLGAGCVLTIGPILLQHGSPYESWSGSLMRFGLAVYFVGRLSRHRAEAANTRRLDDLQGNRR